ncbi:MAG: S-methyl-5-thioribose-1-phosphate isomerase, partial [Candidatus Acidiferrales bacterium]
MVILDQRLLPGEVVYHTYRDYREVAAAIKDMVIRGAPAIGVAAAMGVALGVEQSQAGDITSLGADFERICDTISKTRPTAVDLFWALRRMHER